MRSLTITNQITAELLQRFGLCKGSYVSFEKVATFLPSSVRIGAKAEGVLQTDIELDNVVTFCDSIARLSPIQKIMVKDDVLYLETSTSLYQNISFKAPLPGKSFSWSQIHHIVTEKGSVYRYLPNLKTQRYKVVENYLSAMKDLLVFIPDLVHSDLVYEYINTKNTCIRVVNANGQHYKSNEEIEHGGGPIYLTLGRGMTMDRQIPVSHLPKIGYSVFDQTIHADGSNRFHLGHRVTKIALKA